jgi:flagellar biosynthesis/type III secretory pathway M-ring protein FliF/YscJ
MPRVTGKRSPRWPWVILAVIVIAVVVFIVLWATGTIY